VQCGADADNDLSRFRNNTEQMQRGCITDEESMHCRCREDEEQLQSRYITDEEIRSYTEDAEKRRYNADA
jgi:hypothetical protein